MIKNIVFDIGNVMVRWDPPGMVAKVFLASEVEELTEIIFRSEAWMNYNRGNCTLPELIDYYHQKLGLEISRLQELMYLVKELDLLEDSVIMQNILHQAGYQLYALTDTSHEVIDRLKTKYDFWEKFNGIVASCDLGVLKPSPEIYHYLLDTYQLQPHETLFLDDVAANVAGAKAVGMCSIQFSDAQSCFRDMQQQFSICI